MVHAGFLAPLVRTRGFGMTPLNVEFKTEPLPNFGPAFSSEHREQTVEEQRVQRRVRSNLVLNAAMK